MRLLIDDADIVKIKEVYQYYPISGVTTNPSVLAKIGRCPYEVLKEIREYIGADAELHVQALSLTAEEMVKEGDRIREKLGKNTFVKVPATREGLKAIKLLSREGVSVTATAIYVPIQAYLAAEAGATYVAPYINRIDIIGGNGIQVAKDISDIFMNNQFETEVLAASFKNTQQVLELVKYGIKGATVSTEVIEKFLELDVVKSAVDHFAEDFENLYGKGQTM